ncbi:MAG TPA: tRNA preQ1(34) S-adenosylmethionine ribosyltransferase-isomerase QueA [Planctomycetaceae bacterium]|nr:tRNA preQ1(34) S-adenosylmethionine ribosyltransferase-isomerase QueA [Planctomycetaceae bacterium]HRF02141.1 tRNA preQ1(34) S-adenosylmethionine ribosyltransferase-isomerase QueA [Pirellulaceae bacterium]
MSEGDTTDIPADTGSSPEIAQYDYDLPKELIAQQPLATRTDARLMVVDRARGTIDHHHVRDLPELISARDALVLNNTRVIPAKLVGYRTSTKGRWYGLFLEADEHGVARLLGKTRGALQPGETVTLQNRNGVDDSRLVLLARLAGGHWAARLETPEPWPQLLERVGRVPLPHYIHSDREDAREREIYQTVFAKHAGSVAAPTAGLHFTKDLLIYLNDMGVELCSVTLHVGIGTFRPVSVDKLDDHRMHAERGSISPETASRLRGVRERGGRVIAVGTTSVRVLETAARGGSIEAWQGETDVFIRPGHRFQAIDGLLTNFHLPRSTLLVLVRTFGGDELMREAYATAIRERYRFYSYGDAMLIL